MFIAGTRADRTLHAKVVLIEKAATTTTTPTATPSTTVAPTTHTDGGRHPDALRDHQRVPRNRRYALLIR